MLGATSLIPLKQSSAELWPRGERSYRGTFSLVLVLCGAPFCFTAPHVAHTLVTEVPGTLSSSLLSCRKSSLNTLEGGQPSSGLKSALPRGISGHGPQHFLLSLVLVLAQLRRSTRP